MLYIRTSNASFAPRSGRALVWMRSAPSIRTATSIGRMAPCTSSGSSERARRPDAARCTGRPLKAEDRLWKQTPQRLREVLAQGAERAKIPRVTPHALRHTFGTRWLQVGGDIYKLSKILGHSSVVVTEAHYAHLLNEDLVAASQQMKITVAPRASENVVWMPRRARN
jgi:hypothetical protein